MFSEKERIGVSITTVVGVSWWESAEPMLQLLLIFMVLDFITGVIVAIMLSELSAKKMFTGLGKKTLVLLAVLVAHLIEKKSGLGLHVDSAVAGWYTAMELTSLLENMVRADVPVPKLLKESLMFYQKKGDSGLYDASGRRVDGTAENGVKGGTGREHSFGNETRPNTTGT